MPDTPVLTPEVAPVGDEHRAPARKPTPRKEPKVVDPAAAGATAIGSATASASPPSTTSGIPTQTSTSDVLLREMLEELRMLRRMRQHNDFSLGHLVGAIAQAFSICALGWALYAALGDYKMAYVDASLRVLFAIAFQMLALTGFLAGNRKG